MDPSVYAFSPGSMLPQESKLATYMNRGSTPNPLQPLVRMIPSPTELKPVNAEFIPSAFYTGLEEISVSPKDPSPTHAISAPPQIAAASTTQVHQENVGGTTYFYSTNAESVPAAHSANTDPQITGVSSSSAQFTIPQMYSGTPTHMSSIPGNLKSGLASSFYMPDVLRSEILMKNQISLQQPEAHAYPEMPSAVEQYVDLIPLEDNCGSVSTYRGSHRQSGLLFALRRLHDFRLSSTKCPLLIDKWKTLQHPNIARLREVFSTKAFGDNSLIFVYEYHPGCTTLMQTYMSSINSNGQYDSFSSDPDAPRPYSHQKNTLLRATHGASLLPESTIWSLLVQLTAALRAIHTPGLACRKLDPSKVIVSGYRVRISWCGVEEVAGAVGGAPTVTPEAAEQAQQDDLTALGRMVLALACRAPMSPALTHTQLQLLNRSYSQDLKNLILYLLSVTSRRSVTDLMPMIGARFYVQIEALQHRADTLEDQLAAELDNSRHYRLLVKLATINERPEFNMDSSWAETGDRYMLKLFRDYLFHSVTSDGRPWLDHAHLTYCLNQLDIGTHNRVQLMSRDEQSVLVVSFAELKHCLEQAFEEISQAASSG